MTVKIAAQLTKEKRELNGLNRIEAELIDQPRGTRYGVFAYSVKRVSEEIDEGVEIPTIQFEHIEPVDGVLADRVREMLAGQYKDRTGKSLDGDPTLFDVTDGPREVPEASADEILAERAERKAAEAEAERAGQVPAATFQDGGTDG